MSPQIVRTPKQHRAIQKRDAILHASYHLFCEKGYFHTNTAEIAKAAKVSTGIIYNYFHDKHDILLAVINLYLAKLHDSFISTVESAQAIPLPELLNQLIEDVLASHKMQQKAHDQFHAIALLDEDIMAAFDEFEKKILSVLLSHLHTQGYTQPDLAERLCLSYHLIEQFCHISLRSSKPACHQDSLKSLTISSIVALLEFPQ